MDYFHVRELAERASTTKSGSQSRQQFIAETAKVMLTHIEQADVRSASDFRLWSQTWMVPRLEDIVRAANGERVDG